MDFGAIFKRAFLDTVGFFAKNFFGNPRNLCLPILFVAGTATHLYRFGWEEAMEEFNVFISYGIIPVGSFVILLFVSNLILAPSRILYEAISNGHHIEAENEMIEPVNYAAWDSVDPLQVFEAGCLWGETEPNVSVPQGTPMAYYSMLINSVFLRAIKVYGPNGFQVLNVENLDIPMLLIKREDLMKLAKEKNERPKFLFPEERK